MTPEQEKLFCQIASMGVACGLEHRYEWLANYLHHFLQTAPYNEVSALQAAAWDTFLAFEKSTASCGEEEIELRTMTHKDFGAKMAAWYARKRAN